MSWPEDFKSDVANLLAYCQRSRHGKSLTSLKFDVDCSIFTRSCERRKLTVYAKAVKNHGLWIKSVLELRSIVTASHRLLTADRPIVANRPIH